jgi:hypothetical protein
MDGDIMKLKNKKMNFNDSAFPDLDVKTNQLKSIFKEYLLDDIIIAVFAITSWRDNRSALESCLALNNAVIHCASFGVKQINDYRDFKEFFSKVEPILKISNLDDVVVNDFGEIHICITNQFYPIITGTGHTGSVYCAMQFLESLAILLDKTAEMYQLLNYAKNMINTLRLSNLSGFEEVPIVFVLPSNDYFQITRKYIEAKPTSILDSELLQVYSNINDPITSIHFLHKNNEFFPLFNASLLIDFYSSLLDNASLKLIKNHINSSLNRKFEAVYFNDVNDPTSVYMHNTNIAIDGKISDLGKAAFYCSQGKANMLFIDVDGLKDQQIQRLIREILSAHKNDRLGIVDLNHPLGEKGYLGLKILNTHKLDVIPFDNYTNLSVSHARFGRRDDATVYSAIDLMYLILISDDLAEIAQFNRYLNSNEQEIILSFGGISDLFAFWKDEQGQFSKGAIDYNTLAVSFETSSTYVLKLFNSNYEFFPYHLGEEAMGLPEHWKVNLDENDIFQFRGKGLISKDGSGSLLKNGGFIFFTFDILNLILNQEKQDVRSWYDLVSGLNERFILEYQTRLSEIEQLQNKILVFECKSLNTVQQNGKYAEAILVENQPNKCVFKYTVNAPLLINDISNCKNRQIESKYLLDLLNSLFEMFGVSLLTIRKSIFCDSNKDKTVDIKMRQIDFYINQDYVPIHLTDKALIDSRKAIAKIVAMNKIIPGKYSKKDATRIVRKMQDSLVSTFESEMMEFDRLALHSELLHCYSTELISNYLNSGAYGLIKNIGIDLQKKSKQKIIKAREDNKNIQSALLYLIETNLFLTLNRGRKILSLKDIEKFVAFSHWLVILQNQSDLCFHTSAETYFIVLEDYRVSVELGKEFERHLSEVKYRQYESDIYEILGDDIDKEYFEKVSDGFFEDTGLDMKVLEIVLCQLMEFSFVSENVNFSEIKPNVVRVKKEDAILDMSAFSVEPVSTQMVQKVYEYLTIDPKSLKSTSDRDHNVLPIWERKQRPIRFDLKPLLLEGDSYIYSPIAIKELRGRLFDGWLQFYPPYETGLDNTLSALWAWKERYEKQFSNHVRDFFRSQNYCYAESDIKLHRFDRKGKHPNDLGDYDVIALDKVGGKLFIIECKVIQPVGSVYEQSMQQKGFFEQNKYDEKFQKRIDYFSNNYRRFFSSLECELSDNECKIIPLMVVNKVFDSYYKKIAFSIITFDELKKLII